MKMNSMPCWIGGGYIKAQFSISPGRPPLMQNAAVKPVVVFLESARHDAGNKTRTRTSLSLSLALFHPAKGRSKLQAL